MCGGGGNAAAAAQQQEAGRQAEISSAVNKINTAFSNRQPQYDQYLNAVRTLNNTELGRQQQIAGRNLKFSLARSGLTGSSVAADQGTELGREMAQGTIQSEQKAQGALSQLQSQDQAERLQLISLANSGADLGNAAVQSANAMRANLGAAMAGQSASTLGDVFGGLAKNYESMQNASMTRKGLNNSNQYLYGNTSAKATGSTFQ